MDHLRAMRVFAKVVDEGGFGKAARALDMAPPMVTRTVADLEAHLGARLLNRTTRTLALSEVGTLYLAQVRAILVAVQEAESGASAAAQVPRGVLRLSCPPLLAAHQLAWRLPTFQAPYPKMTVEIVTPAATDGVAAADGSLDLMIVAANAPPQGDDGSLSCHRLARSHVVACAAPDYLARYGSPQRPQDLADHALLLAPQADLHRHGLLWHSRAPGKAAADAVAVLPTKAPALVSAHAETLLAAARSGLGIAVLPSYAIDDALRRRALVWVLPDWQLSSTLLWAALPTARPVAARTRAFLDFLLQALGGDDADPWLAASSPEPAAKGS